MEPEHGRGMTENTIQSNHDDGNPSVNLNNQVNINSELLQISPAPGDGNAPLVVSNQAETLPVAASCSPISPSSYGSPCGSNNDPSIGLLDAPEGNGVQSATPEPVFAPDYSAEPSPWSMMSASPDGGPGYLIQDSILTEDVDWRNPNQSFFSSPPSQNMVHEDGYDPNRIPSSIFTAVPASPMDWSVASNESLFSIYTGNSFSGYQGMFKSGELGMIEELSPQNPFETFEAKANDESNFSPNLPPLPETCPDDERQHNANIEDEIRIQESSSKNLTDMTEESEENHGNKAFHEENMAASLISAHKGEVFPFERTNSIKNRLSNESARSCSPNHRLSNGSNVSSSSQSRLSIESAKSCGSFAFPVLVTEFSKSCSFRMRPDKKDEQQIKPKQEPPKTTPLAAARGRGCMSCFPLWLRCF